LFSEPFRILGANGIEYPTLLGWLFETKGRETAIILNLSGETIEVGLTPSERFPAQYLQRFGEPAKKVFGVKHINEAAGSIQDGKLSLPPYSITYLSDE
ncbi:MAG: hypothetical protein ACE5GO_10320, partial [Anaerolineales bacterium]